MTGVQTCALPISALPLELAEAILAQEFDAEFGRHYLQKMRRKLGLVQTEQEVHGALVAQLLETMHLTGERARPVMGRGCLGPCLPSSGTAFARRM